MTPLAQVFALALRMGAGLFGVAAGVCGHTADRLDPPSRDGFAWFGDDSLASRPAGVKAQAMADDPEGYFTRVTRERIAQAEQAEEGQS